MVYNRFYNINNIGDGEFIYETLSPTQQYILKAYRINGGSLSADSIRVELIDKKNGTTKNIYFNYPEKDITIKWVDEYHVEINGHSLNILKDKYDWRWQH